MIAYKIVKTTMNTATLAKANCDIVVRYDN